MMTISVRPDQQIWSEVDKNGPGGTNFNVYEANTVKYAQDIGNGSLLFLISKAFYYRQIYIQYPRVTYNYWAFIAQLSSKAGTCRD